MSMDLSPFLGKWELDPQLHEGSLKESIRAMDIPEEFVEMFFKAKFCLVVEKCEGDQWRFSFTVEGSPQVHECGPFKLGEVFEFYDPLCKRTEQIIITAENDHTKEVTVIKENPNVTWTIKRYIQGGQMVYETDVKGIKCKSYMNKI